MRYLNLTSHRCDETGELGLLFDKQRHIPGYQTVALDPIVCAHDVIEHQQGLHRIGPIVDELYALGGIWHARGRWGEIRRDGVGSALAPEEHLAADLSEMGRLIQHTDVPMPRIRRPMPRVWEQEDAWHDICSMADDSLRGEGVSSPVRHEYLDIAKAAMEIGYKLANRRFGTGYRSNNMFWNIAEAIEGPMRWIDFEGQQFRLAYDANTAYCDERYDEDEDEY